MTRIAGKLLILLALLTMPAGMSWAGASAPAGGHAAVMGMTHCPDPAPAADAEPGIAACTMVCSAALPAIGPSASEPQSVSELPLPMLTMKILAGVLLDIATPPPRLS
ncbi:MAG: hypothetical protein ABIS39_04120 [Sphingomicrobium sp.]